MWAQNEFAGGFGFNEDDAEVQNLISGAAMDDTDYFAGVAYADDVDTGGPGNDESLPCLTSIFDHPLITKITIEENGRPIPAWKCGFCVPDQQGLLNNVFKGLPNATKALKHVTRTPGGKIRPCNGNIPPETMRQFQRLKLVREAVKEDRDLGKQVVLTSIEDSQHRVMESMGNAQAQRQQQEVLVSFLYDSIYSLRTFVSSHLFVRSELILLLVLPLVTHARVRNSLGLRQSLPPQTQALVTELRRLSSAVKRGEGILQEAAE
jgi:hypothetical protein